MRAEEEVKMLKAEAFRRYETAKDIALVPYKLAQKLIQSSFGEPDDDAFQRRLDNDDEARVDYENAMKPVTQWYDHQQSVAAKECAERLEVIEKVYG